MQLEEANLVEITKLVEYVDRKEDPLVHIVRMHQHNINLAVLQTARCLKTERSTERNKTNKGQHSRENKRKMAWKEDEWTSAT